MSKVCLVVLIGLPASGKTFFTDTLSRQTKHYIDDCEVLTFSYDRLLCNEHSKQSRSAIENAVDKLLSESPLKVPKTLIIIDDNMYYKSMRKAYYKIARKHRAGYVQVYFEVDVNVSLSRNANRCENERVPASVIEEMAVKMEKPDVNKNAWEANTVFAKSDASEGGFLEEFFVTLLETFNRPLNSSDGEVENVNSDRTKTNETIMHRVDLMLRKIVAEKCRTNPTLADTYGKRRKELFSLIKRNQMYLDADMCGERIYDYLKKIF